MTSRFDDDIYLLNDLTNKTPKFIYIITIFSAIGGFLFGYDTGVISGAMLLLKDTFSLSSFWQESIVSATIGAAIVFALIGGILNDLIGRKVTIILASLIFTIGSICLAVSLSRSNLILGRVIVGCGIGLASMSIPIYIAEMSPPNLRGRLVTLNNVFVTGGQFIASAIAGLFSYDRVHGWRYMLGLAAVPAATQMIAFFFLPESPRWLISKGKDEKAKSVLAKVSGSSDAAETSFRDIKRALTVESHSPQSNTGSANNSGTGNVVDSHYVPSGTNNANVTPSNMVPITSSSSVLWRICQNTGTRRALLLGCYLQILQQLCGINTVMYYSATIIEMSGVRDKSKAIWLAAGTALVNFLCTFIGLYLVERIGRRTLTLFSLGGVIISLSLLAIGFHLTALMSPPITYHPKVFANNPCDTYSYCYTCVEDNSCGFCYLEDPRDRNRALNGSCLPTTRDNSTRSFMGRCMNGIPNYSTKQSENENFYKVLDTRKERRKEYDNIFQRFFKRAPFGDTADDGGNDLIWAYNFCPNRYYWLPILGLFLYLISFAPGMGPMPWTINSEIYPLWARSTANSIASACNWMTNLLVSMTFLTLTELIGKHVTFWLYTIFACMGFIILLICLPETKGKSLEEMEHLFDAPEKSPLLPSNKTQRHEPLSTIKESQEISVNEKSTTEGGFGIGNVLGSLRKSLGDIGNNYQPIERPHVKYVHVKSGIKSKSLETTDSSD